MEPGKYLERVLVPIIAAVVGGLIGSGFGSYLSDQRWSYERTLDSYSKLLRTLDEAVIATSRWPHKLKAAKASGDLSSAISDVSDDAASIYGLIAQARTSITTIRVLQPHRREEATQWLKRFNDSILQLSAASIEVIEGDSTRHRDLQDELQAIRLSVIEAEQSDIPGSIFVSLRWFEYNSSFSLVSVLEGVVANTVFVVVLVVVPLIFVRSRRRSRMLRFFGLQKARRLVIYTSSLKVIPGGSRDAAGNARSYQGGAIPEYEFKIVLDMTQLFRYAVPELEGQPAFLKRMSFTDVRGRVVPSPPTEADIDQSASLVSIGSPAYNSVSAWIEGKESCGLRISPGKISGEFEDDAPNACVVQKVVEEDGRSFFYVAGHNIQGTTQAANYLTGEWKELQKQYGDSGFWVILHVETDGGYSIVSQT